MKRKLLVLLLAICVLTAFMPTCAFAGTKNDTKIVDNFEDLQLALNSSDVNTIIIPYADQKSMLPEGYDDGTKNDLKNAKYEVSSFNSGVPAFRTITIPSDKAVRIPPGKTVVVGGVVNYKSSSCSQGHTSGAYAEIENNGKIIVDGGELKVYGLISGEGEIEALKGSIYEPFLINDYNGGSNTSDIYYHRGNDKQFPFSRYGVINIQNKLTIYSKVNVYGIYGLYYEGKSHSMNVPIMGESNGLINLSANGVYERTFAENRKKSEDGYYNITIKNGATFDSIEVKTADGDKVSSKDRYFGLPYNFTINLENGSYTIPEHVLIRLLPGAKVNVKNEAKLIDSGALLVYPGVSLKEKTGEPYPSSSPAELNNSGTVILSGNAVFAGKIKGGHVEYYDSTIIKSYITNEYGSSSVEGDNANLREVEIYTIENELGATREKKASPTGGPAPAQGTNVKITIYKSNNDSVPLYTYSIKKGEGIAIPKTPTKSYDENHHYTFSRWYDSTTGSTASFGKFDKDTVIWAEYIEEAHALVDGTCTVCGYNNEKYQKEQLEKTAKNAKITAGVKNTKLSKKSIAKSGKGIKLSWTKSKGYSVDYYEVFKSTKKGSFSSTPYYVTKNGTKTSYTNSKGLKKGKTYYYKVRGVRVVDGKKVYTKTVTMSKKYK